MFSGLSRNRPQAPGRSRWPVEANDKHSVLQSIVECAVFIYLFGRVAREKPFVKLRPAYSLKLFFSYVVKGIKVKKKITAKFRALRRLRFEDTKRIMSPEMRPKSFGTLRNRPLERVAICGTREVRQTHPRNMWSFVQAIILILNQMLNCWFESCHHLRLTAVV